MKRLISVPALLLTVALAAGILMAQGTKKDPPDRTKGYKTPPQRSVDAMEAARAKRAKRSGTRDARRPVRPRAPQRPDMGGPMMMQRQQIKALEAQLARKKRVFMEYSSQLKAIRKIALEEDAKKTAEYIDKLLADKEKEFEMSVKNTADKVREVRVRIEKQAKAQAERYQKKRGPRPAPPKPKNRDTKKTGDKKDK